MSRYGVNYYELATYGSSNQSIYLATPFTATPVGYGSIDLSWNSPAGEWSKIKVTRNTYGFPLTPWDGTELDIKNDGTYLAFKETDPTKFRDDVNLGQNTFYYYSIFIYRSTSGYWIRAGNAIALSVKDYKYTDLMYKYLPDVYKLDSMNNPVSDAYNDELYQFLSLFGFELSQHHTYTNLLVNRYDIEKVGGMLLPAFLQEFGLRHEAEIGFQQERILLQNIVPIYKEKGSTEGLNEFIKSYSGYAIPAASSAPNSPVEGISMSANLMLDYNDSSFEESIGHWTSPDSSAVLKCLKEKNITKVALSSNVATITVGAHDYQVGNKIYISGSSYPLFNHTASPVTITAIGSTTISFSLTGTDVPTTNAYNNSTDAYPIVYPYPLAWDEPTTPTLYPNKQNGILAVKNNNAGSGTVALSCGSTNAITKGIPVEAGLAYTFSIYAAGDSSARNVTAGIDWYNRFGVYISSSTGSATSDSTGQFSVRLTAANKTAPTDAYYAVPTLSIASSAGTASNEWHYFDAGQFEQATAASDFDEARQIHITVRANRINELVNPSFAGPAPDPWTITGATSAVIESEASPDYTIYNVNYLTLASGIATLETEVTNEFKVNDYIYVSGVSGITDGTYQVTEWAANSGSLYSYVKVDTGGATTAARTAVTGVIYRSAHSLELTSTGTSITVDSWDGATTSEQMDVYYPDAEYTFSVYVKSSGITDTATLSISWYDDTNVLISTETGDPFTIAAIPGGTVWARPYVTGVAPSTAAYATVSIEIATSNAETVILDNALFERESFVFPYFSGDEGQSSTTSFLWEGTQDASRSHYYKNYSTVSNRLITGALDDQLLLGTTVAIYYAQPNT